MLIAGSENFERHYFLQTLLLTKEKDNVAIASVSYTHLTLPTKA